MNFLSPALLIGLTAALIPPIIHLILRRRAVLTRFPALEFIRRSNKKTARRFRIKQLLLMLVRSLLLGAAAFALARPYLSHGASAVTAPSGIGGATVLVIDATWPMRYSLDGETLLDRARLHAGAILDNIGSGGLTAVTVAGDKASAPMSEVTGDLEGVRRVVESVETSDHFGTLGEAVARAYEILADQPGSIDRRVVVLTTPAGAGSALPQPPPSAEGRPIELFPVDVSDGARLANRAVVDLLLRPAPELGAGQWRIETRVANYADEPVRRLPIHLDLDGKTAVRGFMDLGSGEVGTKTFHARLESETAVSAALVIEGDALPTDDRRDFWLQPAAQIRVLAVNGDPRPTPYRDELFYLERALGPGTEAGARVRLTITAPDTLDRHAFDQFDIVILANFGAPTPEQARALEAFVRGGGGLLITMGDRVEPEVANVRLGKLLPRTLRDRRAAGDAAASAEGRDRQAARLATFDRGHPILRPFADPARTSLGRAEVRRYMLLDPAPDAGGDVIIALDEGAPYLLARTLDRGRVALLTGTIDRDWGDLPIRADFLPLLQQILRYLTRVAEIDTSPVLVGRPAPVPVEDPRVRRVQVKTPSGELHTVERPVAADDAAWVFTETWQPGHYAVQPDPPLPGLVALPGFAVAVDPAGSDVRGQADKPAELAGGGAAGIAARKRTELWHAALLTLFLLLAAEAGLLFKRRREIRV